MNGRANTRMVVKLAERKTEMIGFNGNYNLIDIHNRQFAQGGNSALDQRESKFAKVYFCSHTAL